MFCPKCNKAMDPELPNCKYCGFLNREYDYNKDRTIDVDYKNMPLNIISLLIPVLGIILFLGNKSNKPKMSKSIINYTISGIVLYVAFFVLIKFVL